MSNISKVPEKSDKTIFEYVKTTVTELNKESKDTEKNTFQKIKEGFTSGLDEIHKSVKKD